MSVLFIWLGIASLYFVMRGRIETALLSLYLPALLLLPDGYDLRVPHLPPISAAQWALIPLGCLALWRMLRNGLPSLLDVLVIAFTISTALSEVFREHVMNDGILIAIHNFMFIMLPYAVGRTLIEPNLRLPTVRRFVILILLLGVPGLIEWRLGQSYYGIYGQMIFHTSTVQPNVQMRAGRGRMSASFNDAELAGIVVAITFALNSWLLYIKKRRPGASLGKWLDKVEKYHLAELLFLLYLYLTQSRGPQLALGAGFLILQISRFRNTKLATGLVAAILAIGAFSATVYLARYTNVSDPYAVKDEQQGSALYRRQMNELYKPIAEAGGVLGWGKLSYPLVPSMASIDNEFLLVHLAYGSLGFYLFILVAAESIRRLLILTWNLQSLEDRAFAVSMLGALAILWIAISTVYLGEQTPQIAFFLIGWSRSIVPGKQQETGASETAGSAKFTFKRVFG